MADTAKYTLGYAAAVQRSHSWRNAERCAPDLLVRLSPGDHVLDVGSGVGTITCSLATVVERVTAVEVAEAPAALTRAEAKRRGVKNVDVVVDDATALGFEDDTFDAVHMHQLLQHLADPVSAIREAVRVVRPGGVVSLTEADFGGFRWHPPSPGIEHWLVLYREMVRRNGGEPDAGIHLRQWVNAAGVTVDKVEYLSRSWTFTSPEDTGWWGGTWGERTTDSTLADDLLEAGLATRKEVESLREAWESWSVHTDAFFQVPHGVALIVK